MDTKGVPDIVRVAAGEDRFGEHRGLGISEIDFKVTGAESEARGRILVAFAPAGKMEAFFREVTRADAMPPQDPALWLAHGMQLLGPPLPL
jgi:hypothetical protein